MRSQKIAAGACGAFLAGSLAIAPAVSAAPLRPHAIAVHGTAGRVVEARTARPIAAHFWTHAPLLRNGRYSGTELASSVAVGDKPAAARPASTAAGVTSASFDGLLQSTHGCACAAISQASSAVGTSDIVEVVQSQLSVFSKTGTQLLSVGLNTLLGTTNTLAFPRIIYDPLWNRWVVSVEGLAPTTSDYPQIWTAVSATGDPTGTWYINSTNVYWPGTNALADYPSIGMDRDAILLASNNFQWDPGSSTYAYHDTSTYAIPKAIIYNNSAAWNSTVFFGAFGMVPAIVTGDPIPDTAKTYFVATDLAVGRLHVYSIANDSHYGRQVFHSLADAIYNFAAPPRRVNQPGTTVTLDPGDGRITGPPSQVGTRVWFANGVSFAGYPGIEWGYVTTTASPAAHTASASHSGSSDDFNAALAVVNDSGGKPQVFLSWAYTDTPANVPLHEVWDAQAGGTPHVRNGTPYSAGASTTTEDMSTSASVSIDYSPPCGTSAVVTGQYFGPQGSWRTRIAEVGLC